jgi:hypothetical protein
MMSAPIGESAVQTPPPPQQQQQQPQQQEEDEAGSRREFRAGDTVNYISTGGLLEPASVAAVKYTLGEARFYTLHFDDTSLPAIDTVAGRMQPAGGDTGARGAAASRKKKSKVAGGSDGGTVMAGIPYTWTPRASAESAEAAADFATAAMREADLAGVLTAMCVAGQRHSDRIVPISLSYSAANLSSEASVYLLRITKGSGVGGASGVVVTATKPGVQLRPEHIIKHGSISEAFPWLCSGTGRERQAVGAARSNVPWRVRPKTARGASSAPAAAPASAPAAAPPVSEAHRIGLKARERWLAAAQSQYTSGAGQLSAGAVAWEAPSPSDALRASLWPHTQQVRRCARRVEEVQQHSIARLPPTLKDTSVRAAIAAVAERAEAWAHAVAGDTRSTVVALVEAFDEVRSLGREQLGQAYELRLTAKMPGSLSRVASKGGQAAERRGGERNRGQNARNAVGAKLRAAASEGAPPKAMFDDYSGDGEDSESEISVAGAGAGGGSAGGEPTGGQDGEAAAPCRRLDGDRRDMHADFAFDANLSSKLWLADLSIIDDALAAHNLPWLQWGFMSTLYARGGQPGAQPPSVRMSSGATWVKYAELLKHQLQERAAAAWVCMLEGSALYGPAHHVAPAPEAVSFTTPAAATARSARAAETAPAAAAASPPAASRREATTPLPRTSNVQMAEAPPATAEDGECDGASSAAAVVGESAPAVAGGEQSAPPRKRVTYVLELITDNVDFTLQHEVQGTTDLHYTATMAFHKHVRLKEFETFSYRNHCGAELDCVLASMKADTGNLHYLVAEDAAERDGTQLCFTAAAVAPGDRYPNVRARAALPPPPPPPPPQQEAIAVGDSVSMADENSGGGCWVVVALVMGMATLRGVGSHAFAPLRHAIAVKDLRLVQGQQQPTLRAVLEERRACHLVREGLLPLLRAAVEGGEGAGGGGGDRLAEMGAPPASVAFWRASQGRWATGGARVADLVADPTAASANNAEAGFGMPFRRHTQAPAAEGVLPFAEGSTEGLFAALSAVFTWSAVMAPMAREGDAIGTFTHDCGSLNNYLGMLTKLRDPLRAGAQTPEAQSTLRRSEKLEPHLGDLHVCFSLVTALFYANNALLALLAGAILGKRSVCAANATKKYQVHLGCARVIFRAACQAFLLEAQEAGAFVGTELFSDRGVLNLDGFMRCTDAYEASCAGANGTFRNCCSFLRECAFVLEFHKAVKYHDMTFLEECGWKEFFGLLCGTNQRMYRRMVCECCRYCRLFHPPTQLTPVTAARAAFLPFAVVRSAAGAPGDRELDVWAQRASSPPHERPGDEHGRR